MRRIPRPAESSAFILDRPLILGTILVIVLIGGPLLACGPNFPNMLLNAGDRALLVAPVANFSAELERMRLARPRFKTLLPTNGYPAQTWDAEQTDLQTALALKGIPKHSLERILERHAQERKKLLALTERNAGRALLKADSAPAPIEELPEEFADYFQGSIAWHTGEIKNARETWERLLQRPAENRHFKSTWAAFMLGKAELMEPAPDWGKAIRLFEQVRKFATEGYADTLGLAASSIGWQAKAFFESGNYARAIELYLEQAAGNDPSALVSLQWAADRVLNGNHDSIRAAAANPQVRPVVTAHIISSMSPYGFDPEDTRSGRVVQWLEAVEMANVRDVESAEKLALAAYQAGRFEIAERWVNRADQASLAARWLQAKLRLFHGDVGGAALILAKLTRDFPVLVEPIPPAKPESFAAALRIRTPGAAEDSIAAPNQVLGELAVLHLTRREYAEALDALLHSGFWIDAAYVAERVLTIDELRNYVDRNWPDQEREAKEPETEQRSWAIPDSPSQTSSDLRYLLARRLVRAGHALEAAGYFPNKWRSLFEDLTSFLNSAVDSNSPKQDRASAWFEAAEITRSFGLELYGTETEPDWHVYAGNYKYGVTVESRANMERDAILRPQKDELERAARNHPEPDKRFHYRYAAASLAMNAANLMPDNDDETARILCTAGSWLKDRDPKTADVFYKTLVRRCRKTAVGAEADRIRWFPKIDANGKLIPRPPRRPPPQPPAEPPLIVAQ